MPSVAICSSTAFYQGIASITENCTDVAFELSTQKKAELMQQQDNYTLANFVGQKNEDGLYKANACFIREIFDVIPAVDAVPIVDNKKFAESNYVDPNVFLEMGVAFCFNKPIYLLSDLPTTSSLIEEPKELEPICLRGDLEKIIL